MTDIHTQTGYAVVQVSALGRRKIEVNTDRARSQWRADSLNALSTGERYDVEWYVGEPRQ